MSDSRAGPSTAIWSVRGIGVAVSVSTSTLARELLDALLVRDAEALLFVDDEEAEVLEVDVLREQAVRADDDVDLAVLEAARRVSSCSFFVWKRDSARDRRSGSRACAPRRCGSAAARARSSGRGRATCLPAIATRKAARMRDLGLAEADVAADEAIHRARRLEVARSRRRWRAPDRASRRTGRSPRRRGSRRPRAASGVARLRLALGVEAEELVGHLAHALLRRAPWSSRTSARPADRASAPRPRRRSTSGSG